MGMACPAPLSRANLAFLGSALLAKFVANLNFYSQGHSQFQCLKFASEFGETDFYTPPMLRGAALFDTSAPTVYEYPVP